MKFFDFFQSYSKANNTKIKTNSNYHFQIFFKSIKIYDSVNLKQKKEEISGQIIPPKSYWSERLRANQTFKKIKLQFVKFYAFKVVFLEQKKVLQNILVINTMRTVTNVSMIISLVFYFR
jgi:uncharacterized protein YcgI (DUF1989 family)